MMIICIVFYPFFINRFDWFFNVGGKIPYLIDALTNYKSGFIMKGTQVSTSTCYFSEIHFNYIFSFLPISLILSPPLWFYNQNVVRISHFSHLCYISYSYHPAWYNYCNSTRLRFQIWKFPYIFFSIRQRYSYLCNRPWRPIVLRDVKALPFSRQLAHRWWWGCQPCTIAIFTPFPPPGNFSPFFC
jgi:hypothetical protein